MKGQLVNLNRERWLGLANLAMAAAGSLKYDDVETLGLAAAKMQAATPPANETVAMTACLTFRWACQHFAAAPGMVRPALGPGLIVYAGEIRRIFDHTPAPREAASMPVPVQQNLIEPELPRWTARADCGG
jgi:hypothetical protein